MSEKKNILIVPDVHGRAFWKEAVEEYLQQCSKIVFLGDYTDPYQMEGISWRSALENFQQIIDFKQGHQEQVVLLLGNHDLHYLSSEFTRGSRYSSSHAREVKELLQSHASFFQFAHQEQLANRTFLFTHAGVSPSWYQDHHEEIGTLDAEALNRLDTPYHRLNMLSEVSPYRGGWDRHGSFLWSDVNEWYEDSCIDGIYQVFGHTQLADAPIICPHWACLDCRRAFLLKATEGNDFEFEEITKS